MKHKAFASLAEGGIMLLAKTHYRIDEVARIFDVNPRTVRNWIDNGNIDAVKVGGTVRIKRDAIEACQKKIDPLDIIWEDL
jgi:excisionase family DNA binding protein